MARSRYYLETLEATANIQMNVALILEAKALEAEKARGWLCSHFDGSQIPAHSDRVKQVIEIHEQIIEIIDGIVKMENGLASNLKVLLGEPESSGGMGGGLFDTGGQTNDLFK